MGPVGVQEMIVIFLVALVLFGPKKLPELGRTLGKALTEFRRAQSELKSTFEGHMRELERESQSLKEVASDVHRNVYDAGQSYSYDSPYYDSGAYGAESNETAAGVAATQQITAANPPTVGASATQDAENTVSRHGVATEEHASLPVNGTVPRSAHPENTSDAPRENVPAGNAVNS